MQIGVRLKARNAGTLPFRTGEPITFGVPLPKGECQDGDTWCLAAAGGRGAPVQTRVLDRWIDGSSRWLLVDARVDTTGTPTLDYVLGRGTADDVVSDGIRLTEIGNSIVIDTGSARFTVQAGTDLPFRRVQIGDRDVLGPDGSKLLVVDAAGKVRTATVTSVVVEERGLLRSVVRLEGRADADANHTALTVTARVHFFAGLATVRLLVTLTNPRAAVHKGGFWDLGDPGSICLKDASLTFNLSTRVSTVEVSAEPHEAVTTIPAPVEIYQDSSGGENWQSSNHLNRDRRVPTTFRGYRLRATVGERAGLRATPLVRTPEVGLAAPYFWQNFPQAIEIEADAVTWRMFPGQFGDLHEIQGGEQKTHEVLVAFGADNVSDPPLDWCRTRLVASVEPEWIIGSGAVPFLAQLDPLHASLVSSAVDGPDRFEQKREIIDEYGWRHFGELYGDHESIRQPQPPIVSHYNNQYDAIAGFIYQFLRTSDPRWWGLADDLSRHVIDIDVYHTDGDKSAYNGGLFWHTYHYGDADIATHRTYPAAGRGKIHGGGPSADHNYTTGLMLHYFITGEASSMATVIGLGRFVVNMDDGSQTPFRWLDRGDTGRAILSATGYFGPGRGPANSLNALVDAYRLSGEGAFIKKAEQLVTRVVHPKQNIAALTLDVPEQRWFYTMFLQSLGKFLHHKAERDELDAVYAHGRGSLLHFARWMLDHEHPYFDKPERLEFPTETWPAQDIRKSDVLFYAALHSHGVERQRFAERGSYFRRYSLRTLAELPTRTLLRPVVVLLTSGFLEDWALPRNQFSEPAPVEAADVDDVVPFIPQRVRAERRAKGLVGVAVVVSAAAVLIELLR